MLSSDPIRINIGTREECLPVKAAETAAVEPIVYQRAPTLMAGATAGSQGEVRVWAPSRKLLLTAIAQTGSGALVLCLFHFPFPKWFAYAAGYFWVYLLFSVYIAALRRPCYLTTDEAGIGITTRRGSRTLRWIDIQEARLVTGTSGTLDDCRINLKAPDAIEINLTGYPTEQRDELLQLITRSAGLKIVTGRPRQKLFTRPGGPVLASGQTAPALDHGARNISERRGTG